MAHEAELVARRAAGGDMVVVTLRGPPDLHASHVHPGQYTEIDLGGEQAFFVIASSPGEPAWDLVIRGGGASADTLLALPLGARVPIRTAIGHGFPFDEARGRPLLVAVNGSGIAAARPVMATRISNGDAAATDVFIGARNRGEQALADATAEWVARGARVTVCLWNDESAPPPYARGYVQDVIADRASALTARMHGGMIFAVGAQAMIDALRRVAPSLGVAASDVRTNY